MDGDTITLHRIYKKKTTAENKNQADWHTQIRSAITQQ